VCKCYETNALFQLARFWILPFGVRLEVDSNEIVDGLPSPKLRLMANSLATSSARA
jgi:hypothetical protein